ncbi:hypothetical protein ACWGR4_32060 [Embleya sp. NPDC055664]
MLNRDLAGRDHPNANPAFGVRIHVSPAATDIVEDILADAPNPERSDRRIAMPPDDTNAERPTPPRPVGRRQTQKEMERGIIVWLLVFTFGTHLIGGGIWLYIHFSGRG